MVTLVLPFYFVEFGCMIVFRSSLFLLVLLVWTASNDNESLVLAWYITPPATKSDWQQLASLLANEQDKPSDSYSQVEKLQWDLFGRRQAQDALYRRFVQTARRMKGAKAKYAVLVAKDWGQVLGVAEMGISTMGDRRAILGVLCVSPTARRKGIGQGLVQECENMAARVWQEDVLWVEVETTNDKAWSFFSACGYMDTEERSMVTVQQRQRLEKKSHAVLSKPLTLFATNVTAAEQQNQT